MLRTLPLLLAILLATAVQAQDAVAYPNPLAGPSLTVETSHPDAAFELYDLLGRRLDARSDLAAGVYLWRLRLADGTRTDAQPLTRLSAGPLDVHLAPSAARAPFGPTAEAGAAALEGCRIGAPVFGGFQHEPRRGSAVEIDVTASVTAGSGFAILETCLPRVGGVAYSFPAGASPFAIGTSQFKADLRAELPDGTPDGIPIDLRTISGQRADLRVGVDAASPRWVYVLDFLPDGGVALLDSAFVAAGTPVTRRLARVWAGGPVELAGLAVANQFERPTGSLLDSAAVAVLAFRTTDPNGVTIQIAGATVQGDAIAVVLPADGPLAFDQAQLSSARNAFGIDEIGFIAYGHEGGTGLAPTSEGRPMWLRTADPNGLNSMDGSTMEIGCARGRSCETYGVVGVPSLFSTAGAGNELAAGTAPTASTVHFSGLKTGLGRGLLYRPGGQIEIESIYRSIPEGVTGGVRVVAGTPGSLSLVIGVQDVGDTPTIAGGEIVYLREGVVRRQFDLTLGTPVDLGLRVELSDVIVTVEPDGSPLLRFVDTFRPNSEVQVRLDRSGPPVSDYYTVTFENIARWSFGSILVSNEN